MSRRPGSAGRGATALAVSAESAVPLPQLPIARVGGSRRLPKALAFAAFMALCGALWETAPVLLSRLSLPLQWAGFPKSTLTDLLFGVGLHESELAFSLRTALVMLLLAAAGFVCSYRASRSARPIAALDNGAC